MIQKAAFIRATHQLWKLVVALACPIILGLVILYQEWFGEGVAAFRDNLIVLTVLAFIGFAWGCLSIICPKMSLPAPGANGRSEGFHFLGPLVRDVHGMPQVPILSGRARKGGIG